MGRLRNDFQYMILNSFINRIPSWNIRRVCYKSMGMQIGANARIGIYTVVTCPRNIKIGNSTIVNEYCLLDGRGHLTIGNNTSISMYSKFITATHMMNDDNFKYYEESTVVGDNVWLGTSAIVLNGSNIENGCVIGAGCCFKGHAKEREVWIGNPAKNIKNRECINEYKIEYNPYFR